MDPSDSLPSRSALSVVTNQNVGCTSVIFLDQSLLRPDCRLLSQILGLQLAINCQGRSGPVSDRVHDKLHISLGIAGQKQSLHSGPASPIDSNTTLRIEFATQGVREVTMLDLLCIKKYRIARQTLARFEANCIQMMTF